MSYLPGELKVWVFPSLSYCTLLVMSETTH